MTNTVQELSHRGGVGINVCLIPFAGGLSVFFSIARAGGGKFSSYLFRFDGQNRDFHFFYDCFGSQWFGGKENAVKGYPRTRVWGQPPADGAHTRAISFTPDTGLGAANHRVVCMHSGTLTGRRHAR
jgi:hypothetical protein